MGVSCCLMVILQATVFFASLPMVHGQSLKGCPRRKGLLNTKCIGTLMKPLLRNHKRQLSSNTNIMNTTMSIHISTNGYVGTTFPPGFALTVAAHSTVLELTGPTTTPQTSISLPLASSTLLSMPKSLSAGIGTTSTGRVVTALPIVSGSTTTQVDPTSSGSSNSKVDVPSTSNPTLGVETATNPLNIESLSAASAGPSVIATYITQTDSSTTKVVQIYSTIIQTTDPGVAAMIVSPFGTPPASPTQHSVTSTTSFIATQQSPVTTLGRTIIPNPTGFSIASTTLLPYGPALTVSGTLVSLNPSALVIGSSTIPFLSAPHPTPSPTTTSVFSAAGHGFTAAATGFAIDGITLIPGGSGITVSGTPVRLGTASDLVIGTSTIKLPATSLGGAATGDITLPTSSLTSRPTISNNATSPTFSTGAGSGATKTGICLIIQIAILLCIVIGIPSSSDFG